MTIDELFFDLDEFCIRHQHLFQAKQLAATVDETRLRRNRPSRLTLSEVMTILVWFHQSHTRDFKHFYLHEVTKHLRAEFPQLVSYNRFVEIAQEAAWPLMRYLEERKGARTGLAFIDSMAIAVCHNARIQQHRLFRGLAQRGKTSTGWFYGFKLHLVINECGEILSVKLTPGNVDDRKPVRELTKTLTGKLCGDRGYISKALFGDLLQRGLHLITRPKQNMLAAKKAVMPLFDRLMLRKRAIIESVNDQLQNIAQIEHTRHRSVTGFLVNVVAALVSYCLQPKKPSLRFTSEHALADCV